MITALLLALAAGQLNAEPAPRPRQYRNEGPPRTSRLGQSDLPFFSAFDTNGLGTTTACSTTPPTGAKGETLTFTRASSATCTKTASGGLATTGIADGDLVSLTNNVARVMYDSAGTLGLGVEAARTNRLLRSEELDNAAWTQNGGIAVTANFAMAPDGTLTADRIIYDAVNDTLVQADTVGGVAAATSVFLRGTSTSGAIDLCRGGGSPQCVVCNYVATSWTRCELAANFATSSNVFLGCDAPTKGSACSAAGDVLAWGMSNELGGYATSYIPTGAGTATRAVETASFALPVAMSANAGSHAATVTLEWPVTASVTLTHFLRYDGSAQPMYYTGGAATLRMWDGTTEPSIATTITPLVPRRVWSSYAGATQTLDNGISSTTGAFDGTLGAGPLSTLGMGSSNLDGIISRICADPNPTRCR